MSSIEARNKAIEANKKLIEQTLAKLAENRKPVDNVFSAAGVDPDVVRSIVNHGRVPAEHQQAFQAALEAGRAEVEELKRQAREKLRAEQGAARHKPKARHDMI